jgi:hypothetical protein
VDAKKTTGVAYTDEERPFTGLSGQTINRWTSYCKIGESVEKFPFPPYGMSRGDKDPPAFMRKKVSRRRRDSPFIGDSTSMMLMRTGCELVTTTFWASY